MTAHDPEVWLSQARQALAPRDTDQTRVLAALEQRLELTSNDAPSELSATRQDLHSIQVSSTSSAASALGIPSTLLRWGLSAIVPLTGVAAVGVFLATRGAAPEPRVTKPAAAATLTPDLADVRDLPIAHDKQNETLHTPEPRSAPPAPSEKKPQRKKCRTAQGAERPCTTVKSSSETAVASASPPPATAASSLGQELSALREAQRALREGQAARALSVLASFEQSAEGPGAMQEERSAAATMARCALALRGETQHGSAHALFEDFARRYPKSAYATRLERTCLPKSPR